MLLLIIVSFQQNSDIIQLLVGKQHWIYILMPIFFTRLYLLTLNFVNILAWSFFLSKGIFVICIVCFCSINLWTLARSCIQIHLNTHLNRIVHCQLAKVVVTLYLRLRNEFQPCPAKNQASNWLTSISISDKRRQQL